MNVRARLFASRPGPASLAAGCLMAVAALKFAAGVAGFLASPDRWTLDTGGVEPSPLLSLLNASAFASGAALLLVGGGRDRRAVALGGALLLVSTSLANRLILAFGDTGSPFGTGAQLLAGINVDAFLPWFFWRFARDFPRAGTSASVARIISRGIGLSLAVGLLLFAANVLLTMRDVIGVSGGWFGAAAEAFRAAPGALLAPGMRILSRILHYPLLIGLAMAALPVAVWNARAANPQERRRVALFLAALTAGPLGIAFEIALQDAIPGYRQLVQNSGFAAVHQAFVYLLLLSVPFGAAYAVLVHHVLDVRLVVRQALQYALAHYTVALVTMLPFAALAIHLFQNRAATVSELIGAGHPMLLLAATIAGTLALTYRRRMLDAIDRRFFREQYDSRRILLDLVNHSRAAASPLDLVGLLRRQIDAALHVEAVAVLLRDRASGLLAAPDGAARPLRAASALATLVAGSSEPLDLNMEDGTPFTRLPVDEQLWIADGGFELLVPMVASQGDLMGMIAIGAKKSELPFHAEDRRMLVAVAAAGLLALENRMLRASTPNHLTDTGDATTDDSTGMIDDHELAAECVGCRLLYQPGTGACRVCGQRLVAGSVPYVLGGKLRFDSRVGAGGMGVVYRATDLTLRRAVAVKTLPRISPKAARRLRREARAVASISHPNLAVIYGAENWRGTPMLLFEFLDGGTLADRLRDAPLPVGEAIRLSASLARALEVVHAGGLVHGDIKPSNIGYRADGTPKLLDFGVARIVGGRPPGDAGDERSLIDLSTDSRAGVLRDGTTEFSLAGTLPYVSPEALDGKPPHPSFDLWSLAVVTYEAVTKRNPVAAPTPLDTIIRIRACAFPPASELRPECPPLLVQFLSDALSPDLGRRPPNAVEFCRRVERVAPMTPA